MNSSRRQPFRSRIIFSKDGNYSWILVVVTLITTGCFIVIGNLAGKPGFPLDDSWIHQTYARNLSLTGRWEYIPGEASAGSTSPLWTILLSLGYLAKITPPFLWPALLSMLLNTGLAVTMHKLLVHFTGTKSAFWIMGCFLLVFDWHLLWSSASGMETLLFCFLYFLTFTLLLGEKHWGWVGVLTGLIVWARPDGMTLLGPILMVCAWKTFKKQMSIKSIIAIMLPLIILLMLYGWFNFSISGKVFPNTYYAKQIEYAGALLQPLWQRLGQIFLIPITGAGIFLIPGFILALIQAVAQRKVELLSMILWFFGYGVLYTIRLPVVYQHGRYLFPLIPVFFLVGIYGTYELVRMIPARMKLIHWFTKMMSICLAACSILFAVIGEKALINDINTINRLFVDPALWVNNNTEKDSIIGVHDIGAMGYFGERKILDLAGLIQPEVIPIIRDEPQIKEFLVKEKADYLVIFKDWYNSFENFGTLIESFDLPTENRIETVEIRKLD